MRSSAYSWNEATGLSSPFWVPKSGAAYLPIDPDYPAERIEFLQQDSHCLVTIDSSLYDAFLSSKEKYLPVPLAERAEPHHLVYLIYTSGSTGTPKGS